jgi:TetR/AcrR family transcriptional regulator, transcriptional repressor for nem operon
MTSEMTDSVSSQGTAVERRPRKQERPRKEERPGKRERLVAAAVQLLHQQGIERTTLADIAEVADVPVGNVYYYFKTKDEVIAAVIGAYTEKMATTLALINARHRSPKGRLKAFVREFASQSEIVAQYGCPFGSLCSELDKRAEGPSFATAELLQVPIQWAEEQFRAIGRRDARSLALDLLAAYEGSALLTNTLRDPNVLVMTERRLENWIDSL